MKTCPDCFNGYDDTTDLCPVDGAKLVQEFEGSSILDQKYQVMQRMGQGGMGTVFRVRHLGLQKTFCLKLIQSNKIRTRRFLSRFRIEARALGRLDHANIVRVTDYGVDPRSGGLPYLVMEYLQGESLADFIQNADQPPREELLEILEDVAKGIDYAHQQNILHRDIKPSNVFLSQDESGTVTAKLLDFGIARILDANVPNDDASSDELPPETAPAEDLGLATVSVDFHAARALKQMEGVHERITLEGSLVGTVAYLAPDYLQTGDSSKLSDIYSFGVLAFETLVGQKPFDGNRFKLINDHLLSDPPIPSEVNQEIPSELDAAILAPLEKEPENRPQTAQACIDSLRRANRTANIKRWYAARLRPSIAFTFLAFVLACVAMVGLVKSGLAARLDWAFFDAQVFLSETRDPNPEILLVSYDEETSQSDDRAVYDQAEAFSTRIDALFRAGARSVAVDIILPPGWGQAPSFVDVVLRHRERLTFGLLSGPDTTIGMEFVHGWIENVLGGELAGDRFGFVNLVRDVDGRLRNGSTFFLDRNGKTRDSFARHAAQTFVGDQTIIPREPQSYLVDLTIDHQKFPRVSWHDLETVLKNEPDIFDDRLVVLGAEYLGSGDENHAIPHPRSMPDSVSGLVFQAMAIDSLLFDLPIKQIPLIRSATLLSLIWLFLFFSLIYLGRPLMAVMCGIALFVVYLFVGFWVFRSAQTVLPTAIPTFAFALAIVGAWIARHFMDPLPEESA